MVDDTGVEVRHRHRRRADGGLAVHLGVVLLDELGIVAAEELARDREASETLCLFNAGFLQQVQRTTARADEHELGVHGPLLAGTDVAYLDDPASVGLLAQVGHGVTEVDVATLAHKVEELLGERTEVDVGALGEPVQRDRIGEVTTLRHQRESRAELARIGDVLHALEENLLRERVVALAEVVDARVAVSEAHVRNRIDELRRAGDDVVVDRVGPELSRDLELLVDGDRLGDVDATVCGLRGVVELAQRRVAGARVVPRVTALSGRGIEPFEEADRPVRLHLPQQRTEGGTHDAGAHERNVRLDHRFRQLGPHFRLHSTTLSCVAEDESSSTSTIVPHRGVCARIASAKCGPDDTCVRASHAPLQWKS